MTSKKHETIGNFEVVNGEVITRREVLLMGAMSLVAAAPALAAEGPAAVVATAAPQGKPGELWVAKDFSNLVKANMTGLSASQIEQHLKLYNGYVAKSNELDGKLKDVDIAGANATYCPLRELLIEQSYAQNGAIYHELYFGNLGGKGGEPAGQLRAAVEERFGSTAKFMDYLKAAGKSMRGWVILGYNTRDGHIHTYGLDMHNMYVPANTVPIMVLDVYEHAYMIDYGIDRAKYLDAFVANLDWGICGKRFESAIKHPAGGEA